MSVRPVRYPGKLGAQGIIARGGHLLVAERSRPDAPGPREDRDPLVLGPRPEIWTDRPRGVCFVAPMLRLWEAVAAAPQAGGAGVQGHLAAQFARLPLRRRDGQHRLRLGRDRSGHRRRHPRP